MQPIRRAGGALDFDLTEEQQLFADTSRRFLADECDLSTVRKLAESDAGFTADWWCRAAGLGWISLLVDEDAGGLGGWAAKAFSTWAWLAEEMGSDGVSRAVVAL